MRQTRSPRFLPALFALLVLAACSDPFGSEPVPVTGETREQLEKWKAQRLHDYRFIVSRNCFCPPEATQPARVEVRGGRVARVTSVRTGTALDVRLGFTVDQLFAWIAAAERDGTYLSVLYHPRRGHPVEAVIGTLANDAGVGYSISSLEAIR